VRCVGQGFSAHSPLGAAEGREGLEDVREREGSERRVVCKEGFDAEEDEGAGGAFLSTF
jgi:hypothetical protein